MEPDPTVPLALIAGNGVGDGRRVGMGAGVDTVVSVGNGVFVGNCSLSDTLSSIVAISNGVATGSFGIAVDIDSIVSVGVTALAKDVGIDSTIVVATAVEDVVTTATSPLSINAGPKVTAKPRQMPINIITAAMEGNGFLDLRAFFARVSFLVAGITRAC